MTQDMRKAVHEAVETIIDALPEPGDDIVIGEALGKVAALLLTRFSDDEVEVWIKAVRQTRAYLMRHGHDN